MMALFIMMSKIVYYHIDHHVGHVYFHIGRHVGHNFDDACHGIDQVDVAGLRRLGEHSASHCSSQRLAKHQIMMIKNIQNIYLHKSVKFEHLVTMTRFGKRLLV